MTALQETRKNMEGRTCMQTPPDPFEHLETAGKVIGIIAGVLGLFATIKKAWNKWRDKHPTFRKQVLKCLDEIKQGQRRFEDFNAATLRERIGSIYNLYVLEMGWCPRSQKEKIALLFNIYKEYYGDDVEDIIIDNDKAVIMGLPESKDQRQEYTQ
jgi:hypothetical protein